VNHKQTNKYTRAGIPGSMSVFRCCVLAAALMVQVPRLSLAAETIVASAVSRYEYNSNVFDLQGANPVPGTSDFQHSDSLYTYGAGLDVNYLWSQQKLFAIMSFNEFRYDHFTQLNHHEYTLDGGLNWKLGLLLDGTIEVMRNDTMVPFSNVETASFVMQTEQRESAKIGFEFVPDWRIEGSGRYRTIDQSSATLPNLELKESFGEVGLKYVGRAGVTSGLTGGYTVGDYTGGIGLSDLSYKQTNVDLVATYDATGRSNFNGALGYSDRTSSSSLNSISGFTGELDYNYRLTGKTSMQMRVGRTINSYVANSSSEIDTGAALTVHWQATYTLGVEVGYAWTSRDLPGQGDAPLGGERIDHDQLATIKIDYEALQWLSIKPYVSLETRSSNFIGENIVGANFNATVYGVNFIARWQDHPKKN
jgi:hypothetical protein